MSKTYLTFSTYPFYYGEVPIFPFSPFYMAGSFPISSTSYVPNNNYQDNTEINKIPKLHRYATSGNVKKILKLVKSANIDINVTNSDKETALHIAVNHKQVKAIQALIYSGIDTGIKDKHDNTARDLLIKDPDVQTMFESFIYSLHKHNIEVIVNTLKKVTPFNSELPYLPNVLVNLIAEYTIDSEAWLESGISIEEVTLLGGNGNSNCCNIL